MYLGRKHLPYSIATLSHINELPIDCNVEIIDFLVTNVPIMVVSIGSEEVLINIKDFIHDKDVFTLLIFDENKSNTQISTVDLVETQRPTKNRSNETAWKSTAVAPVSYSHWSCWRLYPATPFLLNAGEGNQLVQELVSLKQIRKHVMNEVPGLQEKGIIRDAIHFLLAPPRKNTIRAERFSYWRKGSCKKKHLPRTKTQTNVSFLQEWNIEKKLLHHIRKNAPVTSSTN